MNLLEGQKELASASKKLRSMFIVRGGEDQPYQVMFNTVLQDSRPPLHRHMVAESFICIEGKFEIHLFYPEKQVEDIVTMHPGDIFKVKAGQYHTFKCLTSLGVVMEFTNEYYDPKTHKDIWLGGSDL